MSLELVPLCGIDVTLAEPLRVGAGPSGQRTVAEITGMTFTGRLTGTLKGHAAADWITMGRCGHHRRAGDDRDA